MVKIIAVYNYKGGVGKTTTTINLGTKIAMHEKKVLLVDADPQCNLTSFFTKIDDGKLEEVNTVSKSIIRCETTSDEYESAGMERVEDKGRYRNNLQSCVEHDLICDGNDGLYVQSENRHDLYHMLRRIFSGTFDEKNEQKYELINLKNNFPKISYMSNLYLLPGSAFISEFEEELKEKATELNIRFRGCFRRLLRKLASEIEADYVLVDFSPSSGNFNKNFIMNCDYILPVAKADKFSCFSAHSLLTKVFNDWFEYADRIRASEERMFRRPDKNRRANEYSSYRVNLSPFRFKAENPGILPFIVTSYRLSSRNKNQDNKIKKCLIKSSILGRKKSICTKGCSFWIRQLKKIVSDPKISDKVYSNMISFNNDLVIPFIPMLDRLVNESSALSIPIPSLGELPTVMIDTTSRAMVKLINNRLSSLFKALEKLPQK